MKAVCLVVLTIMACVFSVRETMYGQTEDDVVINEFVVNPATGKEYVELLVVAQSVNLQGWSISDVGTRAGSTSSTEGDITLPASAAYLASVPQGTYVVIELTTPTANVSILTEDTSLTDPTPKTLLIKTTTPGLTTAGTCDWSTNENIHLYAGPRASATMIDQILWGSNTSYIAGAAWGDNNGATTTDNISGGSSVSTGSGVRFVPVNQSTPDGFRANDDGSAFVVEASSYGTPGTVNAGVDDAPLPIQLVSLTATQAGNDAVIVLWTTMSEIENYGFEVGRSDQPQADFRLISRLIPGHGTTNTRHDYAYTDNTVAPGVWYYRLAQIDLDGTRHYSDVITVSVVGTSSETTPSQFMLSQNYPNPFNPTTSIIYAISDVGTRLGVSVKVYDLLGRQVAVLVDEWKPAGSYSVQFDGSGLATGVYIYSIIAGEFVAARRMLLVR